MVRAFLLFVFSVMCAHHFPLCQALEKVEIPTQGITPNINQADNDRMEHTQQQHSELIEWIRSHPGGFVNDKLEIRRADIKNPSSGSGMFVSGAIKKGELLYSVPWDLIIKPDDYDGDDEYYGDSRNKPELSCETVYSLIDELNLGDKSKFGPYLKYFHDFKTNYLIEHWSETGTDLINYIAGYDMKEDSSFLRYWYEMCDGSDDLLHEKAVLYVTTRAEDFFLIPLFDLANHRNGHINHAHINKKIEIVGGISADGIATRDIAAGEEIVHSYYLHDEVLTDEDYIGCTTTLLSTFGFVEPMPQRWIFENDLVDNKMVVFDLDYAKSDTEQDEGELEVRWRDDRPNQDTLLFFREELERLDQVSANLATDDSQGILSLMSKNEYNVASRYHEALVVAVRNAIFATEQELAIQRSNWDLGSEEDACEGRFCDWRMAI
eukprot:scaffold23904_cov62-Attheya_sp.AAC.3